MKNNVYAEMINISKKHDLPKFYKEDLVLDKTDLDRFEGKDFIWVLRTCGTNLVPLYSGVHPCFVTNYFVGPGTDDNAIPYLISGNTITQLSNEKALELIQTPPSLVGATDSLDCLIDRVNDLLLYSKEKRMHGTFVPTNHEPEEWLKWLSSFRDNGNDLMVNFMEDVIRLREKLKLKLLDSSVDVTAYAESIGYSGESPVLVENGEVISHGNVNWHQFAHDLRLTSSSQVH